MKLIPLALVASLVATSFATDADLLYLSAMERLSTLPSKYEGITPIYHSDNLDKGIRIPSYDAEVQDYEAVLPTREYPHNNVLSEVMADLYSAMNAGCSQAAETLADLYTFGNYSLPSNYTKAVEFYQRAVESSPSGHAYFMLGFMYSTGMLGERPIDRQRAKVYYEFAARNGDTNALLVLAYNQFHGIGCSVDCELAQFYYSRLARHVMTLLSETSIDLENIVTPNNINLADFNGGLYGEKISESDSSVLSHIDKLVSMRESLRERNVESLDSQILDLYFDALEHYHGGFFFVKNSTLAFREALTCAYLGKKELSTKPSSMSKTDKSICGLCQGLLGHMYLNGEGVERNLAKAYYWLSSSVEVKPDKNNLLDLAMLRRLDPTTDGVFSDSYMHYLQDAASNYSIHGLFLYAKNHVVIEPPFRTTYSDSTFDLMKKAAYGGHHEATFYLADAVESGFAPSFSETFDCSDLVSFFKSFVERSELLLLPHLSYAYQELSYGNYKNALLGYSIAAEQGLLQSQLSAANLLYQMEPLFTRRKKVFPPGRVHLALRYLELASAQGHTDATILLGDLHYNGIPHCDVAIDYDRAFAYYSKAASSASAHGCYKLGHMYEYGLGCANNTADYYMAKRYYDLSIKYYQNDRDTISTRTRPSANTYLIGLALLRLRLKVLFTGSKKQNDLESTSWLGTLKKVSSSSEEMDSSEDKSTIEATAHQEGGIYDEDDDYELFDYIVLVLTFAFFLYVGFQNLRGQMMGMGQRRNADNPAHANEANRPRFQFEVNFAL